MSADDKKFIIPKKFGKYEIIEELGRGSMAVVLLGYDPFIDRHVAIKVALPKFFKKDSSAERFRKMFFNEARISGMLDNRFILPIYDAGMDNDLLYIVMEHVKGGRTLKDFCRHDNLLPVQKVLEIMYKCAKALDYAHKRDVIHRDIKPTNILVTQELDVRIADFGIAQLIQKDMEPESGLMGSPRYMSPEQVSERTLNHQSDLFSLGVVMYELLTGYLPFRAPTFDELANQILTEEAPLLSTYRADLPGELENIVRRAMSKNTVSRYSSGHDLASDLVLAFKRHSNMHVSTDSSQQERFQRIKGNRFFREFLDAEIREVMGASEWGEFDAGETIVTEGAIDDCLYIIIKGKVDVVKGENILATLTEGDCFGEMAFFTKQKRSASIVSVDNVMLLKVNNTLMEKASMICQVRFMKEFLFTLIERLSKTSRKLAAPPQANQQ